MLEKFDGDRPNNLALSGALDRSFLKRRRRKVKLITSSRNNEFLAVIKERTKSETLALKF